MMVGTSEDSNSSKDMVSSEWQIMADQVPKIARFLDSKYGKADSQGTE